MIPATHTFFGAPYDPFGTGATRFAFLGVPEGTCGPSPAAAAPDAVRACTHQQGYARGFHHHDFDLDGPLFPAGPLDGWLVDAGDVPPALAAAGQPPGELITSAVSDLLARGALPLVAGGDDSIAPAVLRAYGPSPLHVLHLDAHLDYRDDVDGRRYTDATHVRRLREMSQVDRIVQVGMRGVGSSGPDDLAAAREAGNRVVTADDLQAHGVRWLVDQLPLDRPWVVTIDADGLDRSIAPGVRCPQPGGLSWEQTVAPVRALAGAGRLAALVVTAHQPCHDPSGVTALTFVRLMVNAMGYAQRHQAAGPASSANPFVG